MNEQIKQLAEQAGPLQEVLSEIYGGTPGRYVRNKALLDFQLEKFALLIVRECVNRVRSRQMFAIEDDQNVNHAFDLLVYDIKSHFGVEE